MALEQPLAQAPDHCEPIEGWRVWYTSASSVQAVLRSPFRYATWHPRERMDAECAMPRIWWWGNRHHAPALDCECGIYASTWSSFVQQLDVTAPRRWQLPVLGTVSLWGSVVEAEAGWRGEFAYPSRLFVPVPERYEDWATAIVDGLTAYGVPVEVVCSDSKDAVLDRLADLARPQPA